MGKRNRERIQRIEQGKELPRSATNAVSFSPPPRMIQIAKSNVGRQQRRYNIKLERHFAYKEGLVTQRQERDRMAKSQRSSK
jgi:hypothetical protein